MSSKLGSAKVKTVRTVPAVFSGAETNLHGEIISWDMKGAPIPHSEVLDALGSAGLPVDVAKEILPRHAFTRACAKLDDNRIIRKVDENETEVIFQFTREELSRGEFRYDFETRLTLVKSTGQILCVNPTLAAQAKAELERAMELRTPSDVTKIIQTLVERNADMFPIRNQGGVYFVPQEHVAFIDSIHRFISTLNGSMPRFPVPKGTERGDSAVKMSVAEGLDTLIREHVEAIQNFDIGTHAGSFEKKAEAIRITRHKIESYREYLGGECERLQSVVNEAAALLREKIETIGAEKDAAKGEDGPPVPEEVAAKRSAAAFKAHETRRRMKAERAALASA